MYNQPKQRIKFIVEYVKVLVSHKVNTIRNEVVTVFTGYIPRRSKCDFTFPNGQYRPTNFLYCIDKNICFITS